MTIRQTGIRLYADILAWVLVGAAVSCGAVMAWLDLARWSSYAPARSLFLAAAAAASAALASCRSDPGLPRAAMTFVLAALVLLPAPGGLAVALLAGVAGRGAGVTGPWVGGVRGLAALATGVALVQFVAPWLAFGGPPASAYGLVSVLLLFLVIQAMALGFGALFGGLVEAGPDEPEIRWPALGLELATVPLAWTLVALLVVPRWGHATVLALVVIAVEATLLVHARTLGALRRSNSALAARVSELDTLHAMSREILASLDPDRVFAVVEREVRKVLPAEFTYVALVSAEDGDLEVVYRRRRGESASRESVRLDRGPAVQVMRSKLARRIDDLDQPGADAPPREHRLYRPARSILAVPLIVEDRVIGVLSIESRRARAYDDHGLSLLATIGQQAAIAIQNASDHQRATVDSLTGFQLREHFFRRLAEEHDRAKRYGDTFSLLMIDIDGFKAINDRHGHPAGDQYLRAVSATIRGELRAADLTCRYGGDEFCVLLPETSAVGAGVIAERIREAAASRLVAVDGLVLRATVSIGVAELAAGGGDGALLLRHADEALYRAKRAGRDRVVRYAA